MNYGALILLSSPRLPGKPQHGIEVSYSIVAVIAAAIGAFLTVNFHFWMGGWVIPTFDPAAATDEGVDLEALLPAFSLVILVAHIALINALTNGTLSTSFRRLSLRKRVSTEEKDRSSSPDSSPVTSMR